MLWRRLLRLDRYAGVSHDTAPAGRCLYPTDEGSDVVL